MLNKCAQEHVAGMLLTSTVPPQSQEGLVLVSSMPAADSYWESGPNILYVGVIKV